MLALIDTGSWQALLFSFVQSAGTLGLAYIAAVVVYRLTLHPLARYPGPFLAKITNLDNLYQSYKSDRHKNFLKCHAKYGPVYRYGPNQLSFNTSTALHDIYGVKSNVQKAEYYSSFSPGLTNTFKVIDKKVHASKKRVITNAFSERALKGMEKYFISNIEKWCDAIKSVAGKEGLNMSNWCTYLTFDVMGDLAFGKSFNLLGSNENRYLPDLMINAGNMGHMSGIEPSLAKLGLTRYLLPAGTAEKRVAYTKYTGQLARERMKLGAEIDRKDFFYYLISAKDSETGDGLQIKDLWGEASLLVTAGSDTTSTALAGTFFYLTHNRAVLVKAREEILTVFKDSTVDDIKTGPRLNSCVYLRACLEETLRLAPPVPSALPREVCTGGATIDGYQIPAGTEVLVSPFVIHRNPDYYPSPLVYRPERWLSKEKWSDGVSRSELEKAQSAFCAFSVGPRSCIGKNMAYMELMISMARILFLFDFESVGTLGESEDRGVWQLGDCFIASKDGPLVKFTERSQN